MSTTGDKETVEAPHSSHLEYDAQNEKAVYNVENQDTVAGHSVGGRPY